MLQIISGKLFAGEPGQQNDLRGVLYTSAEWFGGEPLTTAAGTIIPLSHVRGNRAICYEVVEKIEDSMEVGAIASYGIEKILIEFSAVASFALNIICTPDSNTLNRLLDDSPSIGMSMPARKRVSRIFDSDIHVDQADRAFLQAFVQKLIDLPREKFRVVLRAIRNYVTAVHRLSDDLELSYTLFVASIEALAQKFDGHIAEWIDYDQGKRGLIDRALQGASDDIKDKVRGAILSGEHTAAGRRFRDFAIEYLPVGFFELTADLSHLPIGRIDLPEALRNAYSIRSKYMHELLALPDDLRNGDAGSEMAVVDGRTLLTFEGLSRLARSVIIEFVNRQEVVDKEVYNYRLELPGIVRIRLSPKYWIANPNHVNVNDGLAFLEGYLLVLREFCLSGGAEKLINIQETLRAAVKLFPEMNEAQKRPYAILLSVWNNLGIEESMKICPSFELDPGFVSLVDGPSIESLLAHAVTGNDTGWDACEHGALHDAYFKKRETKKSMRLPRDLEACVCLAYVERLRLSCLHDKARVQISLAIDSFPHVVGIKALALNYKEDIKINWLEIVFPVVKA